MNNLKEQEPQELKDIDWDFYDYVAGLEREWKKSLPKFGDKELLEIFPEAKVVIPEKIKEWTRVKRELTDKIKSKLLFVRDKMTDDFCKQFWREWAKIKYGPELVKVEMHIQRLKRMLIISEGKKIKGHLDETEIQTALAVPIENLVTHPLKKSGGKSLIGLCPLHNEKTPSFHVYPEQNRFWCYGCNQGGDVINFVRLLNGFSFQEAVRYLTSK